MLKYVVIVRIVRQPFAKTCLHGDICFGNIFRVILGNIFSFFFSYLFKIAIICVTIFKALILCSQFS